MIEKYSYYLCMWLGVCEFCTGEGPMTEWKCYLHNEIYFQVPVHSSIFAGDVTQYHAQPPLYCWRISRRRRFPSYTTWLTCGLGSRLLGQLRLRHVECYDICERSDVYTQSIWGGFHDFDAAHSYCVQGYEAIQYTPE